MWGVSLCHYASLNANALLPEVPREALIYKASVFFLGRRYVSKGEGFAIAPFKALN